ncbi:relaxase/mobilization nuclease domain-containing protein [Mucilaginibacter sp. SG564]|uniref:relaxase/mobilization nuclease domain-containing protein n=1 Tax=Mucilaginibacter sp. SG564 TaxID=2587022 RepID=UPI00155216CD|nr:relaxase/mobilization nuclease domain-containing protein [Mucilaginibacter sp. SG564]
MVARFVNGKNIRGMLHYNENKVTKGEARLLLASGFAGDISQFSLEQKLKRFEQLTILNSRVKTNAIHISLNFDPQDKLNAEKLQLISMAYMERIGFSDQPYLVYQHTDAAHTHVHIATVNVQSDGRRIDTHGIGWRLSEPARQALEKEYDLVEAKGKTLSDRFTIKPAAIEKAHYGKTPTKRVITQVVSAVIQDYRFTSLAEFNAVLRQLNVVADLGGEQTVMRKKGGLLYSLIDGKGRQVGVPIKASAIYNKPTLVNLQKEFERNQGRRRQYREPLKKAIEQVFKNHNGLTKNTFVRELRERNITVLFRSNAQGFTYGVTFIDNRNRTVFNGSDLGKGYGANALLERFGSVDKPRCLSPSPIPASQFKEEAEQQLRWIPRLSVVSNQAQVAPSVGRKKKRRKDKQQDQGLNL